MDKYDADVKFLLEADNFDHNVWNAWTNPYSSPGGSLFRHASTDQHSMRHGCLTQVKCGQLPACTPELTEAIRADPEIPNSYLRITRENLPAFARWQRLIDREVRNKATVEIT